MEEEVATEREVQRERKLSLRTVKATERALDTALEQMERTIITLQRRKTLITMRDGERLLQYYDQTVKRMQSLETALADFTRILSS